MWCLAHSRYSMSKMQNKAKMPSDGLKAECIPHCSRGRRVFQTHRAHSLHAPRGAGDPGGHPAVPRETESGRLAFPPSPKH